MLSTIVNQQIPGQVQIGNAQYLWTRDVELALKSSDAAGKGAMKTQKRNYRKKIDTYVAIVDKEKLNKVARKRLEALVITDQHHLEIISMLIEKNITNPNAFEWQQQLRFDHEDDSEHSFIKIFQTKTTFEYGCEYQGNNGRLVVTPLTDRCYMTLTSALY